MDKKESIQVTAEWQSEKQSAFNEKVFYIQECGYKEIGIDEYFRLLFDRYGETYLQPYKNLPSKLIKPDGWYCGLVRYMTRVNMLTGELWKKEHSRSFIVTREYERTLSLIGRDKCYTSPLIYIGNRRPGKNARAFFAFVIDIDGVQVKGLQFFFKAIHDNRAPMPSMIVSSGSGIHLYFLLDRPISLNAYSSPMLHYMKMCLTEKLWGMLTEVTPIQFHGIFQGYRVPGTLPKAEYGIKEVKCFVDINGDIPYYTPTMLNEYFLKEITTDKPLNKYQLDRLESMIFEPGRTKTPIDEAKKLWPDWYKKRKQKVDIKAAVLTIGEQASNYNVNGQPWHVKRDLYDWWLRRLRETTDNKITVGHRYHCILTLAVFAEKCDVPFDELKRDALSLLDFMESLTNEPQNHFQKKDIMDALEAYRESSRLYTRHTLERLSAIPMPPNKRNGRKQELHLKIARNTQAILHQADGIDWRKNNGRKPQWQIVRDWKESHPGIQNISLCAQDCNLTRPTVYKWWNCNDELEAARISEAEKLARIASKKDIDNTVGAMGNTGYVADKKTADVFVTMTADKSAEQVSESIQLDAKERLADFINVATDEIMKMLGIPEPMWPVLRDSFRAKMKDPEFLAAFMQAKDSNQSTPESEVNTIFQSVQNKMTEK